MSKSARTSRTTSRRDFIKIAAAAGAGVAGAPWIARNLQAKPAQITLMRESCYVKEFDEHFQNVMMPEYEKLTGIKINYEIQAAGGAAVARAIAIVESKAPVDLMWPQQEWLFRDALLDVSDIAEEVGKQQGGWYPEIMRLSRWEGKWKSVPFGNIGQVIVYRKDWFDEVGVKKFPDTWDEFYEAGVKLKKKGHPYGMSMGHGYADNNSWLLPLLWSYGAEIVAKDGKTIHLDSHETARAIDYARKLYKDACIEDCVGWTDPANNKAFLTSQISATNNASSILISAKRDLPEMGKVTEEALNPKGPKGRFHSLVPVTHCILSHTPDPEATKAFLRWFMSPKVVSAWYASGFMYFAPFMHAYDKSPEWNKEPRFKPFQQALETGKLWMWPAPADRRAGQVISRFIIADMFSKACLGASTKTVIADAVTQIKQIYGEA